LLIPYIVLDLGTLPDFVGFFRTARPLSWA